MMNNDIRKNGSGYDDPTPYKAIKNIENENNVRFYKLLHTIFHVCELAGFEVEGRMTLRVKKTGKVWR